MGVARNAMGKSKHKNKNRLTNDDNKQDAGLFCAALPTNLCEHERKRGLMVSTPCSYRKVSVHRI